MSEGYLINPDAAQNERLVEAAACRGLTVVEFIGSLIDAATQVPALTEAWAEAVDEAIRVCRLEEKGSEFQSGFCFTGSTWVALGEEGRRRCAQAFTARAWRLGLVRITKDDGAYAWLKRTGTL